MLAVAEAQAATPAWSLQIDVASSPVRLALLFIAGEGGWGRCNHDQACSCVSVSDHLERGTPVLDVLVVRDDPASCQAGADAIVTGRARSLVLWDEPESLSVALHALAWGVNVLPQRAVDLALSAPRLSDRHRATLRHLAAGLSSKGIAAALHESESTAKRDIAELFELFRVDNRRALAAAASRLGFLAHRCNC